MKFITVFQLSESERLLSRCRIVPSEHYEKTQVKTFQIWPQKLGNILRLVNNGSLEASDRILPDVPFDLASHSHVHK